MLAARHIPLAAVTTAAAGASAAGVYVGTLDEILVMVNVTAITGGNVQIFIDTGVDGNETTDATIWHQIASFAAVVAVTANPETAASGIAPNVLTLGKYVNSTAFGDRIRVRWTQTATSVTFTVKLIGKGQ